MTNNHKTFENWLQYVQEELEEKTRLEYENHLYSCDHCLELYVAALESNERNLPKMEDEWAFTDAIMQGIEKNQDEVTTNDRVAAVKIEPNQKKKLQQKTMFNYILAAAMTLLLMSTGVFSQLMNVIQTFESSSTRANTSFVAQIMDKSASLTTKIEKNVQEGKYNE
ncbi:hypothetical protein [Lederbergia citrea]|uniref:Group-specific protein n=1 Tax=Lederbergia citrea TaxID=2833581 RepID=A0A942Z6U5_9BACI|nr:hypothetical protein [Lederbergia citrea]MBS4179452.1 hypothetical protein [Lederbergia citrea]MBS4206120.1 hypothetical protein [Lederbergia citrea]MBS4224431.1 hypothetical protein [Lederbergia citrea]